MLYATMAEARLLLQVDYLEDWVTHAERACEMLLQEFSGLRVVIIYVPQGRVVRYRNGARSGTTDSSSSNDDVSLLLPTRCADYQKLKSLSGEKQEYLGNVVGAADAFFGGFAAGWCRGLGVERSLVWAYGTGQMCGLLPSAQLDVGLQELRELLRLELLDDERLIEALFPEPSAETPPSPPPLLPATFYKQNRLHRIALRGMPSALPNLMGTTDASSQLSLDEVGAMLLESDALGYSPLQRAFELLQVSKKGTAEQSLRRRVVDWFLNARILLSACGNNIDAIALNPLLVADTLSPATAARQNDARFEFFERAQEAGEGGGWKKLARRWFRGDDAWRELVVLPEEDSSIVNFRLRIIDQIDVSRARIRSVP